MAKLKNYSFAKYMDGGKPDVYAVNGKRTSKSRYNALKAKCQMSGILDCFSGETRKDGRHVDRCEGRV